MERGTVMKSKAKKPKRTFSDFLYENNDIILAIVIIALTAIIVAWRFGVIMNYPQTINIDKAAQQTEQQK
jgi:hypothetical protein